eukprot:TRINITY_DN621_c0_g1_i1.p1 TRINITY_DN621_c0_g1~~TRINITY_DN621_c0_g1_i1.p1  ORF type:complete len:78 (+),score=26.67 TRINITY_DN621_c0_g1_i1:210-443(+)
MSRMGHVNTRDEVIEAFKVFDKEQQGYVMADELRQILNDLGDYMEPNEIEELIYEADINADGCIYYETFCDLLFAWD